MKKFAGILVAMVVIAIVASITLTPFTVKSQKSAGTINTAIPEKVMTIVKTSCMACHSDNGSGLAPTAINFSQWDTYPIKKQIKKASAMCREITNGTMPPSDYLAKHSAAVLNAEKIKVICDWAASIKPVE
jgi:cytochrome c5